MTGYDVSVVVGSRWDGLCEKRASANLDAKILFGNPAEINLL